ESPEEEGARSSGPRLPPPLPPPLLLGANSSISRYWPPSPCCFSFLNLSLSFASFSLAAPVSDSHLALNELCCSCVGRPWAEGERSGTERAEEAETGWAEGEKAAGAGAGAAGDPVAIACSCHSGIGCAGGAARRAAEEAALLRAPSDPCGTGSGAYLSGLLA